MTSIERTAYPRLSSERILKPQELNAIYSLTQQEQAFIKSNVRGDTMRLNFAILLKSFQHLGYFPDIKNIAVCTVNHLKKELSLFKDTSYGYVHKTQRYRHYERILAFLEIRRWQKIRNENGKVYHPARKIALQAAFKASQTMNNPADIINVVIEELIHKRFELPGFNTLDQLVKHTRNMVNAKLFNHIFYQLTSDAQESLEKLLEVPFDYNRSLFHQLKELPKRTTVKNFRDLLERHQWLVNLGHFAPLLEDVAKIKLEQFANEAKSLDASNLSEMRPSKRYTLIICLIHMAQNQTKDAIILSFCRAMSKIHHQGKEKLEQLRDRNIDLTYEVLGTFSNILEQFKGQKMTHSLAKNVQATINEKGGVDALLDSCTQVMAYNTRDYYSLLFPFFHSRRSALYKMLLTLKIGSTTQNDSLLQAMKAMLDNRHKRSEYIAFEGHLSFAPKAWQKLIQKKIDNKIVVVRKHFEICVFSSLANEFRSGDLFVEGAESYADYRRDLQDWRVCEEQLPEYCKASGLAGNAKDFVKQLKTGLTQTAREVDAAYPRLSELIIDVQGRPSLKKRIRKTHPAQARWLAKEVQKNMPKRNLLDILCSTHHYTGWGYQYAPISGSDPKIDDPVERYILNTFSQGTALGPAQTAQHTHTTISAHMLSYINCRHATPKTLDNIQTLLVNCSNSFDLVKSWGDGASCAADGTFLAIHKQNLMAENHIRYGGAGGIGYHHVANNYIALFSTFIPCGVWEAIAILDALLNNVSEIQPNTIHADTQGQSTPVFGLAHLLGIKLMPRIRNWKDLIFYRPAQGKKYKHIDSLFGEQIDWELIETHWLDLMQVVLSIKAGKISSALLLKKLGTYSRKNRLYLAFQELGRVIRTKFLLTYISSVKLREDITATTNKVESYNGLGKWLSFGGNVLVASNDPDEMEKAVKYNTILTSAVILQNIVDTSDIVNTLIQEGAAVTRQDLVLLSPYLVEHIKRFGNYIIDLDNVQKLIGNSRNLALN